LKLETYICLSYTEFSRASGFICAHLRKSAAKLISSMASMFAAISAVGLRLGLLFLCVLSVLCGAMLLVLILLSFVFPSCPLWLLRCWFWLRLWCAVFAAISAVSLWFAFPLRP